MSHGPVGGFSVVGGTAGLPLLVDQGAPVDVTVVGPTATPTDACAAQPTTGPVDLSLAAGDAAYVFVHGTSLTDLDTLVVPL